MRAALRDRGPVGELVILVRDTGIALAVALVVMLVLALAGAHLDPVLPVSLALAVAACSWFLRRGIARADASAAPPLDTDPDAARLDGRDLRVRRLEAAAYSAQPARKITARAIGQALGEIAAEREHREDAPPLSEPLRRLIAESAHEDHDAHPVAPIDRATLHRYLRELAVAPPAPIAAPTGRTPHPAPTPTEESRP
ncbi:hypothetical protein [Brachybacterium phenoliresistens]|uniref:Uncharacterized protein n=1 Tax=Brachybacterium phenoliresistens TaxID=396014 RepID=Z9JV14_9MICO|nr:hypothetical protein [Brachybacterium phenoliresistens]EWS81878.1 hypothetical protein BF93_13670 [Brachybacterium phenoliresistens]